MCEPTVKCPLCEVVCLPRQELSCVRSSHGARIEWACQCGARVVLDAKVRPQFRQITKVEFEASKSNPFATGQKFPGEG